MGYLYASSHVLKKTIDASWETPDLTNVTISDIFTAYRKVFLQLTHSSVSGQFFVDLYHAIDSVGMKSTSQTVHDWLIWLGNRTLPTTSTSPDLTEYSIVYQDAWDAGYSITPISPTASTESNLPRSEKTNLLLTKPALNYVENWEYVLAIVNGYVHRIGGSLQGFHVIGGGETGYLSNDNQVGIISFKNIGKIKTLPINHDMLHKVQSDQRYGDYVYLKTPISLTNKTVLLVIGGFLHILDDVYQQLSDNLLRINISHINLPERFFLSRGHINLDSLGIETAVLKPDQIALSELLSDETIVGYLTLPQSFLIIIDKKNPFVRKHYLHTEKLPGRFSGPLPCKKLPVVSHAGQLINVKLLSNDHRAFYQGNRSERPHFLFETQQWVDQTSIDDKRYSSNSWEHASAFQIEFGVFGN